MKKSTHLMFFLIAVILTASECKKPNKAPSDGYTPGANEVLMQNNLFGPATITVPVNTVIKWTNKDGVAHTVTSTGALFDSGIINGGGTYSRQFTIAGIYPYDCTLHPSMTGTIIVQ